ncbi:Diphthine--ammonia ligase, partial [Eumeta japonica]
VAALGLDPRIHLGMAIKDIKPHLMLMSEKYSLNVCGEGGEYETFTLDCPLFRKKLVIDEKEMILHSDDPVAPVGYLNLKRLHLEPKPDMGDEIKLPPSVKGSLDFISDLSDSVFSDLSDIELSETELESIEKLEIEEKKKQEAENLNPLVTYSTNDKADLIDTFDSQNDSLESIEDGYVYERVRGDCEKQPIRDHRTIFGNNHGWYFIGGIVGEGTDTALATEDAMNKLINLLSLENLELRDICSVNVYMRDMGHYKELNDVYARHFSFSEPPTRVCVQCPLPSDVGLVLDAVAHKEPRQVEDEGAAVNRRVTMHVQGISHWAPANIGPYSQAIKVGEVIGTCGQIALVAGSMQLAGGGPRRQSALALRHVKRVLRAVHPRAHIRSVVQSVCYVTHPGTVGEARRQLERRTAGAIVQYAVVEALPRAAAVEWHAWAHTDNNRFEYEETGCNIGEYKVAITRRWNYENTVAAFVCYVATGSSPSACRLAFPNEDACSRHRTLASVMTKADVERVLHYALNKLLNEREEKKSAVKMRIFYQVWSAPPASLLEEAVREVRAARGVGAACTLVPVASLHNAFTFLSISGLRLDE